MAVIKVTGYEISSDPGIQNISSYKGETDTKDITPDMDLERLITDPWWCSAIGPKFKKLTLVELRDTGAVFHYKGEDFFVEFGKSQKVEQVGLSYAYGELWVEVKQ
ncbi:MAG: hypothetical protein IJ814_08380 [Paludibacteraceae bacterium]|nr:hypothetical protein [Paludibacteraceae bacterium]